MANTHLSAILGARINDNVGHFVLPSAPTYVVKDQVGEWDVSIVEDTNKQRLKNLRFVYSIKVIIIAPAFIEVVGIKAHSDISILMSVSQNIS